MSRKSPLYDPNMINEDLRCRGLSMLARLLFAQLAALANLGGGFIKIGPVFVTLEKAAASIGFEGDIAGFVQEIMAMGLLAENDLGWFVPEMKAAQELRDKRSRAGAAGGEATTAKRSDVSSNVICLSKAKNERQSKRYDMATKKEKRTKKEKNNKYIYISDQKVLTEDRGEGENYKAFNGDNFQVYAREYEALQLEFPLFSEDRLYELLDAHDRFMADNPQISNDNWHIPFVAGCRKLHARAA